MIRQLRIERGWTIEELAFMASLDHGVVGRYDRGKVKRPTVGVVRALEEAFGLAKGELQE